ncbi:uncharacterized protein [Eurosta solidaginis]|uniref:uncharacterized protein isoform X2 n=1 Tax=Eurosta solidaginis TaxID=178769 RepID=UPI0035311527
MSCLTFFVTFTLFFAFGSTTSLNVVSEDNMPSAPLPNGAAVDEVVVESSLYIKPKVNMRPQVRRVRSIPFDMPLTSASLLEHIRVKRVPKYQSLPPQYGQSQATANAAAHDIKYVRYGTNTAASNAGAQAFNTFGPNGSFGASSAGTISQATQMGPLGVQNSVGASLSQTYTLPNGQTINFASTNSFANGPFGNNAYSRGSSVAVSKT